MPHSRVTLPSCLQMCVVIGLVGLWMGCGSETTGADLHNGQGDLDAEPMSGDGLLDTGVITLDRGGVVTDGSTEVTGNTDADVEGSDASLSLDMQIPESLTLSTQFFAGTHNSYSGGARGSIVAQLNRGIRCIEFDFHDNDFESVGDYRLGHTRHNTEVELGNGNPDSSALTDWLELVASWSNDNSGHGPIILLLDAKDNLKDNQLPASGNLGQLNDTLRTTLGSRLHRRTQFDEWAPISALQNQILVVLSGDRTTRDAYIVDQGVDPAVTSHISGAVVSMHSDGRDRLWYWTGKLEPGASQIRWLHHGRYDTGVKPSVLLIAANVVVEVHRSHTRDRLFGAVGYIDDAGRLNWRDERSLFDGRNPSLVMAADGRIKLVYETDEFSTGRAERFGRVVNDEIRFDAAQSTQRSVPDVSNNGVLEMISSGVAGNLDTTLLYRLVTEAEFDFVRYEQVMFTEYQSGDGVFLGEQAVFAGFRSGREQSLSQHSDRYVTRLWGYNQGDSMTSTQPNLLSTDEPFSSWFDAKMQVLSALDW
jgi:hypothetical protein